MLNYSKLVILLIFALFFNNSRVYSQYSGNYVVSKSNGDFSSIREACDSIQEYGISGPVIIEIASGGYSNDHIYLDEYTGASSKNTITFKSKAEHYDSVSISDEIAVELEGNSVNHVILEHLTLFTTRDKVMVLDDSCHNITVRDCFLIGKNTNSTSSNHTVIDIVYSTNLTFYNNVIVRGSHGIYKRYSSKPREIANITIENNDINNFHYKGISLESVAECRLLNNKIHSNSSSFRTGIHLSYIGSNSICSNNKIMSYNIGATNPYAVNINYFGTTIYFTNNMISMAGRQSTGLNIDYAAGSIHIYNNSIRCGGVCLYGYTDAVFYISNNILYSFNKGNIFHFSDNNWTHIPTSSNNAVFTKGNFATVSYPYNVTLESLSEYQKEFQEEGGSFFISNPFTLGDTMDLHTCNDSLIGKGINIDNVSHDIDGELRSLLTPSIGADFFQSNMSNFLGSDKGICSDSIINLDAGIGTNYIWSTNDTTRLVDVQNPGIYSVKVNNSCGMFYDTIVVFSKNPEANYSYEASYLTYSFFNNSNFATSYRWDFGDGEFSTEKDPIHIYTQLGLYNVSLITFNECGSDTFSKEISPSVSIGEIDENLLVYPNPAKNQLNFRLAQPISQEIAISIRDMMGKEVLTKTISSNSGTLDGQLNIRELNPGIYVLCFYSVEFTLSKRFIKR